MAGARNSGDWPETGPARSWALSTLMSTFFFLQVREFFVFIEWWGGPGGEF